MSRTVRRSLICLSLLAVVAGGANALVQQRADSPLADLAFTAPALEFADQFSRVADLPADLRLTSLNALLDLGVDADAGIFETRGGRWAARRGVSGTMRASRARARCSSPLAAPSAAAEIEVAAESEVEVAELGM